MKVYMNKPILVLLGLSMLWTLSMFIAPATMEPGTVHHLDGTSVLDYNDRWAELNPFARVVYTFGDSQCHQIHERSYSINGNQLPLCARCMALFMWGNLGVVTAMLVLPEYDISAAAVKLFPRRMRRYIKRRGLVLVSWFVLCVLCVLPTATDGILQLVSSYSSTNLRRVLFSLPTGWFGGLALGLMLNNIHYNIYEDGGRKGHGAYTAPGVSRPGFYEGTETEGTHADPEGVPVTGPEEGAPVTGRAGRPPPSDPFSEE